MSPPREAQTGFRSSRLAHWILSPGVRKATFVLLLLGFGVGVGTYMHVINRYVHFSVRLHASVTADAGGHAGLRVHAYRPDRLQRLRGDVEVRAGDGSGPLLERRPLTATPTLFTLPVPDDAAERAAYRVTVAIEGEEQPRHIGLEIPIRRRSPSSSIADLPPPGSARRVVPQAQAERAQVRRIRMEPSDAPLRMTIVSETGFPVRFLENRFLLRLTDRQGQPIGNWPLTGHIVSGGTAQIASLRTDSMGLAEFAVTPIDVETWRIRTQTQDGASVTAQFELVPGFDGTLLRLAQPIVSRVAPISAHLVTDSGADRWYYDVYGGASWLATGERPSGQRSYRLAAPGGAWFPDRTVWRYGHVQAYSQPFSRSPQSSVRGLLFRPDDATELEAAQHLVGALSDHPIDGDYLRALQALGLPGAETPAEARNRLIEFLLVRLLPTYVAPHQYYDDTQPQQAALLAETTTFRRRMHWLLGLGALGLMSWILGRILLSSMGIRRRTAALLVDLPEENSSESTLAPTRSAVLPLVLATVTIAAFFVGVLLMLASM